MMATEANDTVEKLLQDFSAAAPKDFESVRAALEANDVNISDLSMSDLKAMFRDVKEKKCNRCEFVGEDLSDLKKHLRNENHFYGQENLVIGKKKLIQRVKDRRVDAALPQVHFPVESDARQQLTAEEVAAFNSFATDHNLTQAEKSTYDNLVYTGLNCIIMRSSVDAPSPSSHKAAVMRVTRVLAANATVNATPTEDEDLTLALEGLEV